MAPIVKQEIAEPRSPPNRDGSPPVIHVSSDDDDDDSDWGVSDGEDDLPPSAKRPRVSEESEGRSKKLRKAVAELPSGFLDPLPTGEDFPAAPLAVLAPKPISVWPPPAVAEREKGSRQFWKAGDYVGKPTGDSVSLSAGMDHVRVHPKFLHSNATSHKWALGAFAELLDNSIDEVSRGATFVNVDMLESKKDGNKMLLVEDNGGGMDPDRMRQCMSLGYSMKSKSANTIGQYGNGFKTSTMRLGADVIVFSRCHGKGGRSPTQSIGMLSYTFLRDTAKDDIVVPMIDYEKGEAWNRLTRSSSDVWNKNLETILQWSPYSSEIDLLKQFDSTGQQGTRIVIYNLWDDDQGELELDFDADVHDIQVRGVNRDDKKIEMAKQFPNSRHFLTYRHSLRSYASILYLRLPHGFRMILRGKEIEHHNIVNDMMMMQNVIYRPVGGDGVPKDQNMVADVTIGFVKDAKNHIDIQGFNVYHKNRLIKPFWRLWNAAGSDGRGVIGVLEANFVEPAHDKQDFERTTVLSRLEARLVLMQKAYWTTNCHKIGYAPRRNKKGNGSEDKESSLETLQPSSQHRRKVASQSSIYPDVSKSKSSNKHQSSDKPLYLRNKAGENGASVAGSANGKKVDEKLKNINSTPSGLHERSHAANDKSGLETECIPTDRSNLNHLATRPHFKGAHVTCTGNGPSPENSSLSIKQLTEENKALKSRIKELEDKLFHELQSVRDQNKALTEQLKSVEMKLEESKKEQEALIDIFSEERCRRDAEEENLRKRLKGASNTIQELVERLYAKDRSVKRER